MCKNQMQRILRNLQEGVKKCRFRNFAAVIFRFNSFMMIVSLIIIRKEEKEEEGKKMLLHRYVSKGEAGREVKG